MIPLFILAIENEADREFMTELFTQYQRLIYYTTRQITQDEWAVDDIVQETLINLMGKISLLRSRDRERQINYIISTTKNTAYNYMRTRKNVTIFAFDEEMDSLTDDPIEDSLEQQSILDDLDCLRRVWPKLDPRSQYLLEARYILEKPLDQMAADLGMNPGSLRMFLTRAKRRAKALMLAEMVEK